MNLKEVLFSDSLTILRTKSSAIGMYDTFFNGWYLNDYFVRPQKLLILSLLVVSLFFILKEMSSPKGSREKMLRGLGLLLFTLFVILLNHPVDETFVNLRHSMHLAEVGNFSFNRFTSIEGIVDFLPFFILGVLYKLGLPLVEMAFLQSWISGFLVILASFKILATFELNPKARSLISFFLCLFPALIFNSTTGFANTTLTAGIVWAAYFLFFSPKTKTGLLLIAVIPLIRLEGALISILFFIAHLWRERLTKRALGLRAAWCFAPITALSIYRQVHFGSLVPICVRYKSTPTPFFLKIGLTRLLEELNSGLGLYGILAIALSLFLLRKNSRKIGSLVPLIMVTLLLLAFSIPYYLSGGDWFPVYWGRYLLPFSFFSFFSGAVASSLAWIEGNSQTRKILLVVFTSLLLPQFFPSSSLYVLGNQAMRSSFAGHGNERIQYLSKLGNHLRTTTEPRDVIASTEDATIMYFARREGMDLLGLLNSDLLGQPLVQMEPLPLLHRKHKPELIAEKRPAIIWAPEFASGHLNPSFSNEALTRDMLRIERTYQEWSRFYFGGSTNLISLGYHPVLVVYPNRFFAMYYVSPLIWEEHLRKLKDQGFYENPESIASARM